MRGLGSAHGERGDHDHRRRTRRRARGAPLQPESDALGRGGYHEARPRALPRRGRRRVRPRQRRSARLAPALPRRHRRRAVLLEEPAEGHPGLRAQRARDLPEREIPSAARDRRAGRRRLGGADEHRRVPSLAVESRAAGPARRGAHRPRPAAGHRLRRRDPGRPRAARPPRRGGSHAVRQDLGQSRTARLRADRTDARVPRGAPRRDRDRPRAGAPDARSRHHRLVEGGARRQDLRRLQPGQSRPHHGRRLQSARAPDRDRLDPGHLGGAADGRSGRVHRRHRARPAARHGRPVGVVRRASRLARHPDGLVGARPRRRPRGAPVPSRLPEDAGGSRRACSRAARRRPTDRRSARRRRYSGSRAGRPAGADRDHRDHHRDARYGGADRRAGADRWRPRRGRNHAAARSARPRGRGGARARRRIARRDDPRLRRLARRTAPPPIVASSPTATCAACR